ncbi:hypothetical protein [Butyrivibrio fibrisolvens]|uniref:hypothetical protein n=1 Tax=Butyrivibrio fibrisolvens TaxID=831 RepID=UPI0003B363AC|nr:hypothetical protein [Butyrivibrio fibrisolvens]
MKKSKAILIISAAIGAAAAFTGCGKQKVDLNSFIKIDSDGYDGYGNASYSIDTENLETELTSIVDASSSNLQSLENLMNGELDKTESLSNGDTLTFNWNISENQEKAIEDKLGIDIVYESFESTVEGLEDPANFDVSSILEITTYGASPTATIEVNAIYEDLNVKVDKSKGLSNGEEVTITIVPRELDKTLEEVCAEYNIPAFDPEFKYTIDGLPNYVKTVDEIPESVLSVMIEKSDKIIADMQTDDSVEADNCGKALYEHKNYDSFKVHSIAVLEEEDGGSIVLVIYELHFSVHGELTTYYPIAFSDIKDSDEGLESSDIRPSDWRAYTTTKMDNLLYYGYDSLDEFTNGTLDHWINVLPYSYEPTGNYDYKEY